MAKPVKTLCDRCESKIVAGVPFCDHCGVPTAWASHDERTAWEVRQWKTADRSMADASSKAGRGSRRWSFYRKTDKPALSLVSTNGPRASATPVVAHAVASEPPASGAPAMEAKPLSKQRETATPPRPARTAVSPIARRSTVAEAARKVTASPRDAEPLSDTPATVLAMRLLNGRVAELEDRIRRLEAELAEKPTSARA